MLLPLTVKIGKRPVLILTKLLLHLIAARLTEQCLIMSDYQRIACAISFIQANVAAQPSLADIARQVNLSPYHFQRRFTRWAGTSPKRF